MEEKYKGVMGLKTHICSYHLNPTRNVYLGRNMNTNIKETLEGIHGVRNDLLVEVIFEKILEGEITISRRNVWLSDVGV